MRKLIKCGKFPRSSLFERFNNCRRRSIIGATKTQSHRYYSLALLLNFEYRLSAKIFAKHILSYDMRSLNDRFSNIRYELQNRLFMKVWTR